jgi:hypothetical protein
MEKTHPNNSLFSNVELLWRGEINGFESTIVAKVAKLVSLSPVSHFLSHRGNIFLFSCVLKCTHIIWLVLGIFYYCLVVFPLF